MKEYGVDNEETMCCAKNPNKVAARLIEPYVGSLNYWEGHDGRMIGLAHNKCDLASEVSGL